MIKIPLQDALNRARENPNSDFAVELRRLIESGELDRPAAEQNVDLSKFGRPSIDRIIGQTSRLEETTRDIQQTGAGIKSRFQKRAGNIRESIEKGLVTDEQSPVSAGFQATGQAAGFLGDVIGELFKGGVKTLTKQETEEKLKEVIQNTGKAIVSTEPVQSLVERWETLKQEDPEAARNVEAALGIGDFVTNLAGVGIAGRGVKTGVRTGLEQAKRLLPSGKQFKSVDELVEATDKALKDSPATARATAEAEAPGLSFKEKFIGLSPDIKKRIAGKQDKMREYIDVAVSRNLDDTVPTPFEHGARKVQQAQDILQKQLNDVGSDIGKTRTKIASIKVANSELGNVESVFKSQLDKLNLTIKNGEVVQKSGRVSAVASPSDVRALNELWDEVLIMKQSPTFENLVDLRMLFDTRIRFGKSASEVSNSVDPLSRSVRVEIKNVMNKSAGKVAAKEVDEYAKLIDALGQLESYTSRKAGAEYLLRLVLSGRGREAREVIETVKKHTGIDLMDDAQMMTLVTELLGNESQKTLFRQQVTKAGLDAARFLSGDPKGATGILSNFVKERYFDAENILIEAAQ